MVIEKKNSQRNYKSGKLVVDLRFCFATPRLPAMVRQTTRSGTASTVCNSLVESGIGLSTADSSRPVSVLEVLSKCEDSVKLAQMRKKSRGSRSGSVRTLGSARPKSSATITEESIRELDAESSKGDESAIIKRKAAP